jgi:hypothetical protein
LNNISVDNLLELKAYDSGGGEIVRSKGDVLYRKGFVLIFESDQSLRKLFIGESETASERGMDLRYVQSLLCKLIALFMLLIDYFLNLIRCMVDFSNKVRRWSFVQLVVLLLEFPEQKQSQISHKDDLKNCRQLSHSPIDRLILFIIKILHIHFACSYLILVFDKFYFSIKLNTFN